MSRTVLSLPVIVLCACAGSAHPRSKANVVSEVRAVEWVPPARHIQRVDGALGSALRTLEGAQLRFVTDSYELDEGARATLTRVAPTLRAHPTLDVLVLGHADERGDAKYNSSLALRRANAVAAVLIRSGIPRGQIVVVSQGEEAPRPWGHDHAAWAANRRVEIAFRHGDIRILPARASS